MLPKNTTFKLEPCNQGAIRSLQGKIDYANLLVNKDAKNVSLYEDIMMVGTAWANDVTASDIKNS